MLGKNSFAPRPKRTLRWHNCESDTAYCVVGNVLNVELRLDCEPTRERVFVARLDARSLWSHTMREVGNDEDQRDKGKGWMDR